MSTTRARAKKKPQAPTRREQMGLLARRRVQLVAAALVVVGAVAVIVFTGRGGASGPSVRLPNTSDYHSLLVSAGDPNQLLLGTHDGVYRSGDGGRHWARYAAGGQDAMNLVRTSRGTAVWLAGHDALARSSDAGATWQQLKPRGLPSLDLHGFAVDPMHAGRLYAAVAGAGLFRSTDSGGSFSQLSQVGANVMALAVARGGVILAGDMQRGLLASSDGGATWKEALDAQVAGLAIDPADDGTVIATGPGILRSADGGTTWKLVKRLDAGAGPVAFAPSDHRIAYVVGFDRHLYRSTDGGMSWSQVGGGS